MSDSQAFHIRRLTEQDRAWVAHFMEERWHSTMVVSRGQIYHGHLLDGFMAIEGTGDGHMREGVIGLATYRLEKPACELVTLDSLKERMGVGTALIKAVRQAASEAGCKRLWLISTNDNLHALRFYQKRGFRLAALYPNALVESRRLKPQIPLIGNDGIPLRDELELELSL
jgi:DNA-3-methyladenine glycosylase I